MSPKRRLLALAWTLAAAAQTLGQGFETAGMPEDIAKDAPLAEARCSTCHTLKRVLSAKLDQDEWSDVLIAMKKKEKSGISDVDLTRLQAFFAAWSTRDKKPVGTLTARPTAESGGQRDTPRQAPAGIPEPLAFGGPRAWPSPQAGHPVKIHALDRSIPLPWMLPEEFLGAKVAVQEITPLSDGVVVRLIENSEAREISLRHDPARRFESTSTPVRTWVIGPHLFELRLGIYSTSEPANPSVRPDLQLGLFVVRGSPAMLRKVTP